MLNEQDQPDLTLPQATDYERSAPPPEQIVAGVDDEQPQQPQEKNDFAGPTGDDVVGDRRRLRAVVLPVDYTPGGTLVGEAWQDDDGNLHGTGLLAVMLFEPTVQQWYRSGSVGMDVSPLQLLFFKLSRNSFMRVELKDENNG